MLKKVKANSSICKTILNDILKTSKSHFSNQEYTRQMFKAWKENPESVHESWNVYFSNNAITNRNLHLHHI